jgi:hypothetical protein
MRKPPYSRNLTNFITHTDANPHLSVIYTVFAVGHFPYLVLLSSLTEKRHGLNKLA